MHVDAAVRRDIQNLLGQNLSICHNDNAVGLHLSDLLRRFGRAQRFRLIDRYIVLHRQHFHRRRRHGIAPALRLIRLGKYRTYLMSCVQQALQAWNGKIRRSHK